MFARGAADQMKRVALELGGHAPFLVFDDANPVHAAKGAAMVKMLNTGQACISPNRMFVQRTVMQPFLDELVSRVTRMRAGNGLEDGVAVGPPVDEIGRASCRDRVCQYVKISVGAIPLKNNIAQKTQTHV